MAPGDLQAIYLAGGSSRMPIVAQTITERLERKPSTFGDPKAVTALGAIKTADAIVDVPPVAPPPPPDPGPEPVHAADDLDAGTTTRPPPATPPQPSSPRRAHDVPLPAVVAVALASIGSLFLHVVGNQSTWSWFGHHNRAIYLMVGFAAVIVLVAIGRGNARAWTTAAAAAVSVILVGAVTVVPTNVGYHGLMAGFWITAAPALSLALVVGVSVWSYWAPRETQRPASGVLGVLTAAVAVLIGSLFLPAYGSHNAWFVFGHTYLIEVIAASIVVVVLAAVAASGRRGAGLVLAAAVLVLLGFVLPVGYLEGLWIGVWLGSAASAVAALAAIVAARQMDGRATSETTIDA